MGIPASACDSLTCSKAGDSEIFSRIKETDPDEDYAEQKRHPPAPREELLLGKPGEEG